MISKDGNDYFIFGVDKTQWDDDNDHHGWMFELNLQHVDLDFDPAIYVNDYCDNENVCEKFLQSLTFAGGQAGEWFKLVRPGTCTLDDYKNASCGYDFDLYVLCPVDPTVGTLVFQTFDQLMEFLK